MKKLPIFFLSLTAVLATVIMSCKQDNYRVLDGVVWNTTFHMVYNSDKDLDDSVRAVLRKVELSLSPFNDSSLIAGVNRGEDVKVDTLIRKVFDCSKKVSELSDGMYDPTLSPLINLWGFGYTDNDSAPNQREIDLALESVGINDCYIDSTGTIVKKNGATEFNFSSITKGLGCDEVASMLRRNGCVDYMVEIGGEVVIAGMNDRGKKWRIAVEAPEQGWIAARKEAVEVLELTDCGVATSGNYRNFRKDAEGNSYGHTISAVTGYPVATSTLSATVVAPSCMLADALATTAMVVSPASAKEIADRMPGVWLMIVTTNTDGDYVIVEGGDRPE
ncbi:MAG: FAD:protein FMN transferase [Muribaculaceae bacterium]|nr:FAD:protein FMN transferase [Muribaculaceae bacterium]